MVLMAAMIATVLYVPLEIGLALFLGVFGVPLDAFISFGGALNPYAGILVWWLLAFALALGHAAVALPWAQTRGFRLPRQK